MAWFEIFCIGLTAGIIVTAILIMMFSVFKNNDKDNKTTLNNINKKYKYNFNSSNINDEIVEDFIICDILGII